MGISEDVINWLNSTEIPISIISKKTGISRQTLYKWISYKKSNSKFVIQNNKVTKVYNMYSEYIFKEKNSGGLTMSQQERFIAYQESEIQQLKQENLALKKNNNMSIDGMLDTSYQFSMNCEFELSLSTLSVKIKYTKAISNFDYIVKKLGYSKDTLSNDIFSFGKSMNYKDHTIHLLRSPNAKSDMLKIANKIIKSMALTRDTMFSYNLKVPVTYQTKNGEPVHAMNQYVVNWIEKTAIANIHFMNGVE